MKGDDQRAYAAGCDGYMSKPIDTDALPGKVADICRGPTHYGLGDDAVAATLASRNAARSKRAKSCHPCVRDAETRHDASPSVLHLEDSLQDAELIATSWMAGGGRRNGFWKGEGRRWSVCVSARPTTCSKSLDRLVPAMQRAIQEAEIRRTRTRAEAGSVRAKGVALRPVTRP